jgi:hypothetical protein
MTACQKDILLPDLSGKTETEAIQVIEDLGLVPVVQYETDVTVTHGQFTRYEIGFVAGKKVEKGAEITLYIARNGVILPDLVGKTETEVVTALDALDVDYQIAYEHKYSNDDYEFSRFADLEAGELLAFNQTLTVYITWNGALLPDATGMLKHEIIAALEYDFIQNYTFEYIINDEYEEDMFAGYKDLSIGYPAPEEGTITIYLYKNTFTDPDDVTLFISKYLMGEGNTRAIEIYNPTDAAIDLADYHIALFINGAMQPTNIIQLE